MNPNEPPAGPKVLTAADIEALNANHHRCGKDCDCTCGTAYLLPQWRWIIGPDPRWRPKCKCIPQKTETPTEQAGPKDYQALAIAEVAIHTRYGDEEDLRRKVNNHMYHPLEAFAVRSTAEALRLRDENAALIREHSEAIHSLLTDTPLPNGEYPHLFHCNGLRSAKPGTKGVTCCCTPVGLRDLEAANAALREQVAKVKPQLSWEAMAGSIIDTVTLKSEDEVNEAVVDQLKRYFLSEYGGRK